ncbi:MAG: hypothetical protein KDK78_07130, partial [Chlamydiia bacterium]|nr:hypothetical protein [Chlamydiia bacterium]
MKIESTTPQHSPTLENLSIKELEGLSHEQLAQGLCQLNMRTGSQEIVNAKDIPVILDTARSLASRSQVLQQAFDCQDVTLPFLQSLSQRFGTSVWDMAAEYDNAASREILWTWIQENGDLEAYNNVKMIRQIARECIQEANLAGIDFQPFLEDCSSAPNSCYWQTKGGLQLLLDGGCPCKLATPFGMVWLYRGGCYSSLAACSVAERIISRLGATLIDYPPTDDERPAKCVYVVLHRPNPHGLRALDESEMLKIPRSEGKSLIGKHDIVLSNEAGTLSEYEVKSIDGTNVRTLETYDRTDQRRSYGLINKIWQMLENNNQRIAPTPTTTPIEQVSNTPESSDSKPPRFGSLSEAAHWSADCVERLLLEPSKKSD